MFKQTSRFWKEFFPPHLLEWKLFKPDSFLSILYNFFVDCWESSIHPKLWQLKVWNCIVLFVHRQVDIPWFMTFKYSLAHDHASIDLVGWCIDYKHVHVHTKTPPLSRLIIILLCMFSCTWPARVSCFNFLFLCLIDRFIHNFFVFAIEVEYKYLLLVVWWPDIFSNCRGNVDEGNNRGRLCAVLVFEWYEKNIYAFFFLHE